MVNISRRDVLIGAGAAGAAMAVVPARAMPVMTDDGYYKESWFIESFLELADDHAVAKAKGKRFAVMWELQGLPLLQGNALRQFCAARHFQVRAG